MRDLLPENRPLLILAPMQDITDLPFWRIMARYGGPDVYYTEYFRVHRDSRPEEAHPSLHRRESHRQARHRADDRPGPRGPPPHRARAAEAQHRRHRPQLRLPGAHRLQEGRRRRPAPPSGKDRRHPARSPRRRASPLHRQDPHRASIPTRNFPPSSISIAATPSTRSPSTAAPSAKCTSRCSTTTPSSARRVSCRAPSSPTATSATSRRPATWSRPPVRAA